MPKFSQKSLDRLRTCDYKLQSVMEEAINYIDFTVLEGHRDEDRQNELYASGNSEIVYPHSKHNRIPSKAVDIAPYPIDWDDIDRFNQLALVILKVAQDKNIPIRWGGFWTSLKDYPHWEID